MSISLVIVVIFDLSDVSVMILVGLGLLTFSWQATGGTYYYVYCSQIANET